MIQGTVKHYVTGAPLAGVQVSDGRHNTRTDAEGRYTLPGWERGRMVYVCALTTHHNDWYASASEGTVDFSILPAPKKKDFRLLHFSDTEIESDRPVTFLKFVSRTAETYGADLILHTGDICNDTGLRRHYLAMNSESMGIPVRYAIGNHDFVEGDYGEQVYERFYGPTWYSFDLGDRHFAVLSIWKGTFPSGYAETDQWEWLLDDLAQNRGKPLIVCEHDYCTKDEEGFCPRIGELTVPLREYGLDAWIFGHLHYHYLHDFSGVLNMCTSRPTSGGVDSSAAAIRLLKTENGSLQSEMIYYTAPPAEGDPYRWRTALEGKNVYSDPVVAEDRVFVATLDDGWPKRCGVYALDLITGDILWHYPTPDGIKGTVAWSDGVVYAEDTRGRLYALRAADGALLFERDTGITKPNYVKVGPRVFGDRVLAGEQGKIVFYDKKTGELLQSACPEHRAVTPAEYVYDPAHHQYLLSVQWKALIAVDETTLEEKWRFNGEPMHFFRTSTPLVVGDTVYTAGSNAFIALDANTGKLLRGVLQEGRTDVKGAPVYHEGLLYFPTGSFGVCAVDPETLKIVKKYPTEQTALFTVPYEFPPIQTVESSPVIREGKLIFTGSDGGLYEYALDGTLLRRRAIGAPAAAAPAVTPRGIVVADFHGRVTLYDL